jgi:CheY-like chemotaxis protein
MRPNTTVFLVDDDPAVRDSSKLLLETTGFILRDFASGRDFLASGERTLNGCLMLGLHMLLVSGLDLLEQLAIQATVPPTVILTGRADDNIRQRARRRSLRGGREALRHGDVADGDASGDGRGADRALDRLAVATERHPSSGRRQGTDFVVCFRSRRILTN